MKIFRFCIVLLALGCLVAPAMFFGGCAKSLDGNTDANLAPEVWFVNVPPENSQSSVNPIINWYGQDEDGQIDYYRYLVVREDVMGEALGGMPADWNPQAEPLTADQLASYVAINLLEIHDTMWTVLLVRADSTDPHSSNIIPMSAEMQDPVRTYVPQFVFVQAFDEEGMGSEIAFRRFLRNDNPPGTRIVAFVEGVPFINSVFESGPATGIRLRWQGSDVIDYPTDAPPFEFQWKLFGPYSDEELDELLETYRSTVFVTNDARIFKFNDSLGLDSFLTIDTSTVPWDTILDSTTIRGAMFITCDTSFDNGADTIINDGDTLYRDCDTLGIDSIQTSNIWGTVDTLLRVYDEDFYTGRFSNGTNTYRLADSSHDEFGNIWVTDMQETIYDAYWNAPAVTTQAGTFIFVVRSRDDASVPDLTPAWRAFTVINPQHERDVLVMNWSSSAHENKALEDSLSAYWNEAIDNWVAETGHHDVDFDPALDVLDISPYVTDNKMLELILKYKVAIMTQDAAVSGTWSSVGEPVQNTMVALQTGVNVWVTARVPLTAGGSFLIAAPHQAVTAPGAYQYFFGIEEVTFPGWGSHITNFFDGFGYGLPRTEHFIGTLSLDDDQWPELSIDTTRLRTRYHWAGWIPTEQPYGAAQPFMPYLAEFGALPQVGWCVRTYDTEPMYLFKSMYGNEHPLIADLSFHGRPVAIRLNRGLFRTVHFMFTPLALEPETGQQIVNHVMSWLYDGRLEFSTSKRVDNNSTALSADLEDRYWQAYWNANGDRETFYELLKDAY